MSSKIISYGRHSVNNDDIKSVLTVLRSNFLTQGPEVSKFENRTKKIVGSKYSVAVNSATSALHLACLSLGIKPNDIVWISANGFVATSNCALYCNAKIKFIDVDPSTGNISIDKLKENLTKTKKKFLPKLLITVHFGGQPPQQDLIFKLSKKYKFKIIEDASHSLGATYKDERVGSCKWSDITVFSFHPVKIVTSAEGGMCLTNNKKYHNIIKLLRTHGINKKIQSNLKKKVPWLYQQTMLGFNYRMSDIHASLGNSQIKRLSKFIKKRRLLADRYDNFFALNTSFKPLKILKNAKSSFHLYVLKLKNSKQQKNFFEYMKKNKYQLNIHYLSINNHPYYKKFKIKKNDISNWIKLSKQMISIPLFYEFTFLQQKKFLLLINKFIKKYKS